MRIVFAFAALAVLICTSAVYAVSGEGARWTSEERTMLRSLSLASLGPLPADPSNRYADDTAAANLGHELFFDTRLSRTGKVSCASCHMPESDFQDGRPLGVGVDTATRRTMPIAGTAYSPWQFWDGRADSQWEQALGPLENPVEHGGDRTQYAHLVAEQYRQQYEKAFGRLPRIRDLPAHASPVADSTSQAQWKRIPASSQDDITGVYVNIGKAIAAYERRIGSADSRFDRYVEVELGGRNRNPERIFTPDEEKGLRLFIGKANCSSCHNGALFTDNHFHNTGAPPPIVAIAFDSGRSAGVRKALTGEFSCTSRHSDANPDDCAELRFAIAEGSELLRAYKTPSLRNVANRAPYMHAGQFASLEDVVRHYSDAPAAPAGHTELKPLHLSVDEQRQLVAFLRTLTGPLTAPAGYLAAPTHPR
jgi:cytochrome c peroxidase